jgi:signal transduction histidine kinase
MSSPDAASESGVAALKERLHRLEQLYAVSTAVHSTLNPEEALQRIVTEAVRLTGASSGSIALVNPTTERLEIEASCGLPDSARALRLRPGQGITGWVAGKGLAARVGDVARDPRYVMVRREVRSELAVPLPPGEEPRGVLNVDSEQLNAFTEEDQHVLVELAAQAIRVVQNTWRHEQLRLKARLFESLAAIAQGLSSALSLEDALGIITREACALMHGRVSSVLLLDDSGDWLELRASHGAGAAYISKPSLAVAESLVGSVVRRHRPLQEEDVQSSTRYQHGDVARAEGLFGLLSVPLRFGGRTIGVLNVYTGAPHTFSNEEIRILSALGDLSAIAIEKARLYERIVDVEEQLRRNEKLSALGLLAAEVAHEIRNPLTVMKMMFHSLDLRFAEGDPRSMDARIMGEKMDLLNRIVEQVLDFARTAEPRVAPVEVNRLLDELGLLTRHKLKQQGVELVRRLDPALPSIHADAAQLGQVFLNLTLNAVEAMPRGGRLLISTRPARLSRSSLTATHVVIEFRDDGQGMTEDKQRQAFKSLLSTSKAHGTGLGLAIVGRIVESHRGRIRLSSRVGKGTTIRIVLPIAVPG